MSENILAFTLCGCAIGYLLVKVVRLNQQIKELEKEAEWSRKGGE